MKNLKKVLALVLVVVMALGLITVSNAAFSDEATIEKKEAVDVLSAIGVIKGYEDGSFKPEGEVTRAEMAKMIAVIMNEGSEEVNELYKDACKFADSADNWAAGFIAYCAQAGIINGKSETVFDPSGKVTGTEAAKMLLCALGYDASAEGFVGANWASAVLAKASSAKLIGSDYNLTAAMNAPLDRQNAAQMMLNALKADKVEYKNKGIAIVTDQITINTGAETKPVTNDSNPARYTGIDAATEDGHQKVQLGEEKFPKLKKQADDADAFGRPAHVWEFDSKEVTRAPEAVTLTYTDQVKGGELYNALGKVNLNGTYNGFTKTQPTSDSAPVFDALTATKVDDSNYVVKYYIDGDMVYGPTLVGTPTAAPNGTETTYTQSVTSGGTNATDVAHIASANTDDFGRIGDKIEIFKDTDKKVITIVQTNYYHGTIANVYAEKKDASGNVTTAGYITIDGTIIGTRAPKLEDGQFTTPNSFATTAFTAADNGTHVIYTIGRAEDNTSAINPVIQSVEKAETVSGLFSTAIANGTTSYKSVTIAGTTYKATDQTSQITMNEEVTAYLDPNGNVAYLDGVSSNDFVYVIYVQDNTQVGMNTVTTARMVFADGTVKEATVKLWNATSRTWVSNPAVATLTDGLYTYTMDTDGATYKLKAVPNVPAAPATPVANTNYAYTGNGTFGTNANKLNYITQTVNNDTKFIVETYDSGNDAPIYTVYEGVKSLPTIVGSVVNNATPYSGWTYAQGNAQGALTEYAAVWKNGDAAASVVYIFGANVQSKSTDFTALFLTNNDAKTVETNAEYYTVKAIVNGAETTVKVDVSYHDSFINSTTENELVVNNTFTKVSDAISTPTDLNTADNTIPASNVTKHTTGFAYEVDGGTGAFVKFNGTYNAGVIVFADTARYNVDSSLPVYSYNVKTGAVTITTIGAYMPYADANLTSTPQVFDCIYAVNDANDANVLTALYILENN